MRQAIQLNPGYATAHLWHWWLLMTVGRTEEGLAEAEQALKLDPLSPISNRAVGQSYIFAGDYPRAIEHLQKTLELNPKDPLVRHFLTRASLEQGMTPEVFEGFRGQGSRPEIEAELRAAYQEGGSRAFLRKALELEDRSDPEAVRRPSLGGLLDLGKAGRERSDV